MAVPTRCYDLNLAALHTLTQVRRTWEGEGIEELARSLQCVGQLHPLLVAALSPPEADTYVSEFYSLWGEERPPRSAYAPVTLEGAPWVLFVIAGHRRLAALRLLAAEGECGISARAHVFFGVSAEDALSLQLQENLHEAPPPHEVAEALARYFLWKRKQQPTLSVAAFARSVGFSERRVRHSLWFADLPEALRTLAAGTEGVALPWGVMVEIARFAAHYRKVMGREAPHEALFSLANRALWARWSASRAREFVAALLRECANQKNGTFSLFEQELSAQISAGAYGEVSRAVERFLLAGATHYTALTQGRYAAQFPPPLTARQKEHLRRQAEKAARVAYAAQRLYASLLG